MIVSLMVDRLVSFIVFILTKIVSGRRINMANTLAAKRTQYLFVNQSVRDLLISSSVLINLLAKDSTSL